MDESTTTVENSTSRPLAGVDTRTVRRLASAAMAVASIVALDHGKKLKHGVGALRPDILEHHVRAKEPERHALTLNACHSVARRS